MFLILKIFEILWFDRGTFALDKIFEEQSGFNQKVLKPNWRFLAKTSLKRSQEAPQFWKFLICIFLLLFFFFLVNAIVFFYLPSYFLNSIWFFFSFFFLLFFFCLQPFYGSFCWKVEPPLLLKTVFSIKQENFGAFRIMT